MNPIYISLIAQYSPKLARQIVDQITAQAANQDSRYSFLTMLRPEYTPDLSWTSLASSGRIVEADLVAMDSSIPLKLRPSTKGATGDIPKIGTARKLNERQLKTLQMLLLQYNANVGALQAQFKDRIIATLFGDYEACVLGTYERIESMTLEGLSTGVTSISDINENVGIGVRIDYGYLAENKMDSTTAWGQTGYTPVTDLLALVDLADTAGRSVGVVMMDRTSFRQLAASDEAKSLFIQTTGAFGASGITALTLDQMNGVLQSAYGFTIKVVNRTVIRERDGIQTPYKPWAAGSVIALPMDGMIGTLTWTPTTEEMARDTNTDTTYSNPVEWLTGMQWYERNPIAQHTQVVGMVVPVINDVAGIFQLDTLKTLA